MQKSSPQKYFLVLIAVIVLGGVFSSCKKQLAGNPYWDLTMLTPLLQSDLSLDNILADSLIQTNADNSLSLVFSNPVYHFDLTQQALAIPDTTIVNSFSLTNIALANQTLNYDFSLGAMCAQLGLPGTLIIAANGTTTTVPDIPNITSLGNPVDATQFFQNAAIESGYIDMSLTNGLPLTMSNLVFEVKNATDLQVLTRDTFTNLGPGQTQSKTIDLAGKTVEGTLTADIIDLDMLGGTVLIDTSNAINIVMVAHDIIVDSATAIFPAQSLIDQDEEVQYNLDGGAELNVIKAKSGTLTVTVQSTIQQNSHFSFSLPSATDALGNSISVAANLPPAPANGVSSYSQAFDLAGFSIDLTGVDGTKHNTYYNHLIASIDSTGQLVTISKNDSVFIKYTMQDIVPEYAAGYMGQQIFPSNDVAAFNTFNHVTGGTISLEDADVNLAIHNGVGIQGRVNLYELTAMNSRTNQSTSLTWNQLNQPLSISPATDNPLTPSVSNFSLNNSNSNIKQLMELLPDQLKYNLDIFMNPFGNSSNYHDFAYDVSTLDVDLDLQIPLSLIANDLTLVDTVDFSIGTVEEGDATVKDGVFNLIANNGYPLSAKLQLYFYDPSFNFVDSLLLTPNTINAGHLNNQCMVDEPVQTVFSVAVDQNRMQNIRRASQVIIRAAFNTANSSSCGSYIKIYDSYTLSTKLTGKFTYFTGY